MVTIKDIANRLGISVSTVSKGLNGASDISEDLRQMVLDTAVEMGYQSKKMKKDENKKLCLFIENMEYETANQFGYEIILGFRQAAFRNGWSVSVVPVTPAFQMTEKYDTYMLKNGYSGGFLVGFALHDDWMRQLAFTSIPTVLFDNYIKKNVPNFLAAGATAILCGNDLIASGVITECRLRGFSVPDDISVVGFDDLPISSFLEPPLTTVRQERTELGKCGYAALSNLINHVSVSMTLLRPQLITRASTAPCAEREEAAEEE